MATHLGVTGQSLQKKKQWYQRPVEVLEHFQGIMSAYGQVGFPDRLPGDLFDLISNADADRHLQPLHKALLLLFKYSPYRDELRRELAKISKSGTSSKQLLQNVLKACERIPAAKLSAWRTNCGRNVSHHHGFLPTMQSLGVLKKVKVAQAQRKKRATKSCQDCCATGRKHLVSKAAQCCLLGAIVRNCFSSCLRKMESSTSLFGLQAWKAIWKPWYLLQKMSTSVWVEPSPGSQSSMFATPYRT